jgi:hypothetical protein
MERAVVAESTNVDHLMRAALEGGLGDSNGSCASVNNVLMRWRIIFLKKAIQRREEIGHAVTHQDRA